MKKTSLLIAALFALAVTSHANPVGTNTARLVATHFWDTYRSAGVKPATTVTPIAIAEFGHLHFFDVNGTGFVIVSADDCVTPILGYSFENSLSPEPNPEVSYWLNGYEQQIAYAAKSGYTTPAEVSAQWAQLLEDNVPPTPLTLIEHPALLTTTWDQGNPYNMFCPFDSVLNTRAVVGCVATAMAQIMKYWNYPSFGQGSHSYIPHNRHSSFDYGTLTADFGSTTYLWQYMPNNVAIVGQTHQKKAIATLSYHCGVAVDMMYGTSSAAYSDCGYWTSACATNAFRQYFKYDTNLYYAQRDFYSDSAWCALIDNELEQRHPIYYNGRDESSGHAFVLDGADTAGRYHFNWGWSGSYDGFYYINDLSLGGGGYGSTPTHTFNLEQGAIFGIKPAYVETFDTVDYYDSICSESQYIDFHEYHLKAVAMDTLLRHLDTVFNYHLKIISQKRIILNTQCDGNETVIIKYCPATGFTFPNPPCSDRGRIFVGWCHSSTGDDTIYQPGQHIQINTSRSYYALWINDPNAIDDINAEENINLYPNPTSDELTISLATEHAAQIRVIDALGRTILREDYPNTMFDDVKISLKGIPSGLYIVQVKTNERIYNKHIIKQ